MFCVSISTGNPPTRLAIKMKESMEQLHPSGLPTMEITTSTTTLSSTTTIMSSVYLNNSQQSDMSNDSNTKVALGVLKDVGVSFGYSYSYHYKTMDL